MKILKYTLHIQSFLLCLMFILLVILLLRSFPRKYIPFQNISLKNYNSNNWIYEESKKMKNYEERNLLVKTRLVTGFVSMFNFRITEKKEIYNFILYPKNLDIKQKKFLSNIFGNKYGYTLNFDIDFSKNNFDIKMLKNTFSKTEIFDLNNEKMEYFFDILREISGKKNFLENIFLIDTEILNLDCPDFYFFKYPSFYKKL